MNRKTDKTTWYRLRNGRLWPQLAVLGALLCLLMAAAAGMGYVHVGVSDVIRIVASALTGSENLAAAIDPMARAVVVDVRLPRILTAAIVGGALAVSGAVYQGILLNPLADPYTLGVSAGAAFGASIALLINIEWLGGYSVPLFAFAGAVATLMVVMYLAGSAGGFSSNNLILSGIIVAAILSAGISFLKYLADERVAVLVFWLMGSLASKTWADVGIIAAVTGLGTAVCLFFARDLNAVSLGTKTAESLGVDAKRLSPALLVCVSLMAAVCVSVTGIIGFVGLLVPHLVRGVTGPDNRRLMPVSLLVGALLLLAADTVTRAVLPSELPIGVLTALIGGPFFCYVFRRRQMGAMGHGF
ncbi:MAG: iron ABC transporter permease [Desulfobacterales bacterium]|nr:iron ABC transporter permease [Desulfobacterales bacterium]